MLIDLRTEPLTVGDGSRIVIEEEPDKIIVTQRGYYPGTISAALRRLADAIESPADTQGAGFNPRPL